VTSRLRSTESVHQRIEEPTIYIGAAPLSTSASPRRSLQPLYAAYFKDRARGLYSLERGAASAAERAIPGYHAIVDGPGSYTIKELKPSRKAAKPFIPTAEQHPSAAEDATTPPTTSSDDAEAPARPIQGHLTAALEGARGTWSGALGASEKTPLGP